MEAALACVSDLVLRAYCEARGIPCCDTRQEMIARIRDLHQNSIAAFGEEPVVAEPFVTPQRPIRPYQKRMRRTRDEEEEVDALLGLSPSSPELVTDDDDAEEAVENSQPALAAAIKEQTLEELMETLVVRKSPRPYPRFEHSAEERSKARDVMRSMFGTYQEALQVRSDLYDEEIRAAHVRDALIDHMNHPDCSPARVAECMRQVMERKQVLRVDTTLNAVAVDGMWALFKDVFRHAATNPDGSKADSWVQCNTCFTTGEVFYALACGHCFCGNCTKRFTKCPRCRAAIVHKPMRIYI